MSWDAIFAKLNEAIEFVGSLTWADFKELGHDFFWVLVLFTTITMLRKLSTIREIIREFNAARGPIWDLRETIGKLSELKPVIGELGEQMQLLYAKVEAAQRQVAELQVESVSGRTDGGSEPDFGIHTGAVEDDVDRNWETLRDYWRRNTARIEFVIENIKDGRSRISYDRLPRTNYGRIVDKLEDAGLVSVGAANASRELFDLFNSYRPKNRKVPDSVVGVVGLLDKQLDDELAKYQEVEANEDAGSPTPTPLSNQTKATPQPSLKSGDSIGQFQQ